MLRITYLLHVKLYCIVNSNFSLTNFSPIFDLVTHFEQFDIPQTDIRIADKLNIPKTVASFIKELPTKNIKYIRS